MKLSLPSTSTIAVAASSALTLLSLHEVTVVQAEGDQRILQQLPPEADPRIGIVLTAVGAYDRELAKFETPFGARFASYAAGGWWNCVAVYSESFKDTFTKERPAVFVPDVTMHTTDNRLACVAQAGASYSVLSLPGALDGYLADMANISMTVQGTIDQDVMNCDFDVGCLQRVAANNGYNPTIMGHIVAVLEYSYAIDDGWNELGTDVSCQVNCRPYRDPTGFTPSRSPFDSSPRRNDKWEPLLEDNGRGFYFFQEHVAPRIGSLGKFRFLSENDRATRVAVPPTYSRNRISESREVIARMAALDDVKKIEVEVFDDKLLVDNAVIGAFVGKLLQETFDDPDFDHDDGIIVTPERVLSFAMTLTGVVYDSVIIAWKEKISYNLIRPTTVIKGFGNGNRRITTWAPGADVGSPKRFPTRDFEAYIRVMPHSEYVSGSACIFQGLEDLVNTYLTGIGIDPTSFPVAFPPVGRFQSKVEPGLVPDATVQLTYGTIEEMAFVGSESRLDGGMHFGESVPAAKQLCMGIGTVGAIDGLDLI